MDKQKHRILFSPIQFSFYVYPLSIVYGMIIGLAFVYLIISFKSSQSYSSCIEKMEYHREIQYISDCMKKIADTPYFNALFERYQHYVPFLKIDLEKEKNTINQNIDYYTSLLMYNPKSPKILLSLSKLYVLKNDLILSKYYLDQARHIDPKIK